MSYLLTLHSSCAKYRLKRRSIGQPLWRWHLQQLAHKYYQQKQQTQAYTKISEHKTVKNYFSKWSSSSLSNATAGHPFVRKTLRALIRIYSAIDKTPYLYIYVYGYILQFEFIYLPQTLSNSSASQRSFAALVLPLNFCLTFFDNSIAWRRNLTAS